MSYEVVFRTLHCEQWGFTGPVEVTGRTFAEAARNAELMANEWTQRDPPGTHGPYYHVHLLRDTYLDHASGPAAPLDDLVHVAATPIVEQVKRVTAPSKM